MINLAATKLLVMKHEHNRTNDLNLEHDNPECNKKTEENEVHLTEREQEIIDWMSHGYSQKEIGDKLNIAPKTVSCHLESIRKKIGVTKNTEILAYFICQQRGKKFSLRLLRDYGIAIFLIYLNVCRPDL